jgi:cytochrome c oxidase cbb3-type subunit 3
MRRVILIPLLLLLSACEREDRDFDAEASKEEKVAVSTLAPGGEPPQGAVNEEARKLEGNAFAISQGKKLLTWFNCSGCHGNGGGGSGPALMDDKWTYGSSIENIAATIREGRPNGMPSFRGHVPEQQVWQLAAYVRALGALASKDAAPGRNDDMQSSPAENRMIPDPFGPASYSPPAGPPRTTSPASPAPP